MRNLRGAFALEPTRPLALRGKHVVLIDDLMTSGASLFAAARLLRDEGGAAHVAAIVFARTDRPNAH